LSIYCLFIFFFLLLIGFLSSYSTGSFYGVPHSTLEYKVKERHLLRRPKRKDTELSHKSSPESSLSGSDPQNSGTPGAEISSNSLPLTPDLRESLSRYMNIGNTGGGSTSSGNHHPPNHGKNVLSRESRIDNHSLGLGSPFMNLYGSGLDDLIRQNLGSNSNSLLDLTKK